MKVLVCGGRDFENRALMYEVLDLIADEAKSAGDPIEAIIAGGAKGADFLADVWAISRNVRSIAFIADWARHGKAAGPMRNQRMLDEGKPDLVIGFPGGRGTADMLRRARAAGLPTKEISAPRSSPAKDGET